MQRKPYVGVTGPVTKTEIIGIHHFFSQSGFNMESSHLPMIGLLVSYKTLELGYHPTNRRYPILNADVSCPLDNPPDDLVSLLEVIGGRAFKTVHYNTKSPGTLADEVNRIFSEGGIYENNLCRGLQVNVPWPPPEQVDEIMAMYPEMSVIIQLSGKAMEGLNNFQIAERTAEFYPHAQHVLIDPSEGRGLGFGVSKSSELYHDLRAFGVKSTIGFAGGLSGENVRAVVGALGSLINTYDFSIDAESRIRDKLSQEYGDDIMNPKKVEYYIKEASRAFGIIPFPSRAS